MGLWNQERTSYVLLRKTIGSGDSRITLRLTHELCECYFREQNCFEGLMEGVLMARLSLRQSC